eukprot:gene2413-510_t
MLLYCVGTCNALGQTHVHVGVSVNKLVPQNLMVPQSLPWSSPVPIQKARLVMNAGAMTCLARPTLAQLVQMIAAGTVRLIRTAWHGVAGVCKLERCRQHHSTRQVSGSTAPGQIISPLATTRLLAMYRILITVCDGVHLRALPAAQSGTGTGACVLSVPCTCTLCVPRTSGHLRAHDTLNAVGLYSDGPPMPSDPYGVNALGLLLVPARTSSKVLVDHDSFFSAGIDRISPVHSKNRLGVSWQTQWQGGYLINITATFYLVDEASFACRLAVRNLLPSAASPLVDVVLGVATKKNRPGFSVQVDPPNQTGVGYALVSGNAETPYYALGGGWSSQPQAHSFFTSPQDLSNRLFRDYNSSSNAYSPDASSPFVFFSRTWKVSLPANGESQSTVVVSRSHGYGSPSSPSQALDALESSVGGQAENQWNARVSDDASFWAGALALHGDWPAAWARGVVYDLDTVRHNIRPSIGVFKHPWDGMQVFGPRIVVAEFHMDMMALSYVDPASAMRNLYGLYADAAARGTPNMPCLNEDGTPNMTYGGDRSSRSIRAVEHQAAMAHGAATMAHLAGELGMPNSESLFWLSVRDRHMNLTRSLWRSDVNWFCDYNSVTSQWQSGCDDGDTGAGKQDMQLAPLFWSDPALGCDLLKDIDPQPLLAVLEDPAMFNTTPPGVVVPSHYCTSEPQDKRCVGDVWPPHPFLQLSAAANFPSGRTTAAELTKGLLDTAYAVADSRNRQPGSPYPGVSPECWHSGDIGPPLGSQCGAENYAWSAQATMVSLIRNIVGFRPSLRADGFVLQPAIPNSFLVHGSSYEVSGIRFTEEWLLSIKHMPCTGREQDPHAPPAALHTTISVFNHLGHRVGGVEFDALAGGRQSYFVHCTAQGVVGPVTVTTGNGGDLADDINRPADVCTT